MKNAALLIGVAALLGMAFEEASNELTVTVSGMS